jgi:hypothetical protein
MIASAAFGRREGRVRRLAFVPRAAMPLDAACAVAREVEIVLREVLGECELAVGTPVAIDATAWAALTRDALLYVRRGGPADAVLVLPRGDARRLAQHALGEPGGVPDADRACSPLEQRLLERVAARCTASMEPLCGPGGPGASGRAVDHREVPPCCTLVDLRARSPIPLTLAVGLTRAVPEPPPSRTVGTEPLAAVTLEARAVFAEGIVNAADFVRLRPGHVVKLLTKVGAPASLNVEGVRLAEGVAGAVASRTAFLVHDVATGAHGR